MRRLRVLAWLLSAPLLLNSVGCSKPNQRRKAEDPLLRSKTPVQAKYTVPPEPVAHSGPLPPATPAGAWAAAPVGNAYNTRLHSPDLPPLTGSPSETWSRERSGAAGMLVSRSKQTYAKGAGMHWLQGVLERLGDQWVLRYESLSGEASGGKVLLTGHPRLDMLHPGDVIRVEGELVQELRETGAWLPHPRYRVDQLQVVRQGG
jgi:hypothetical protein